ncbi:very-long-chain 3-oxoacyl-CoA reductase [Cimex lectularius]|uniref:Uncharacterized protein n=1 Tax=Cimex lectularius TaxID=79782 RepID=A0A8I6RLC1_CIMLE|nr:very-long-chain 3-oxoacyl-CoA reductase [Cimex lectularius]
MFTFLEKVGILFLIVIALKLLKHLSVFLYHTLAPFLNFTADFKSMGTWAVVTGGTDGLGKAFAEQLAKKGIHIVLISRTKSKLEAVASEIESKYNVMTRIIEADFTEGENVYQHIEQELFGLEIGVLVNNVGISYPYPDYFLELEKKEKIYNDILQCNIASMLIMCQIVMPGMVERKKGIIINVSSTAANIPSPFLSVYAASKIFVTKFSQDLASEYRKKGVVIQCLTPGYVATKMSKIKKPTWMAPTPTVYTQKALKTVGIESCTTGYFPHALLLQCIKTMKYLSPALAEWLIIKTMLNIRRRALKKCPPTILPN